MTLRKIIGTSLLMLTSSLVRADIDSGNINVMGLHRVDKETILAYLPYDFSIKSATLNDLDQTVKSLYNTGLFSDVKVHKSGNELVIDVQEHPIVNEVYIEGNKALSDEVLRAEVAMKPRSVYTKSKVQKGLSKLLAAYRAKKGMFSVKIVPKIIKRPENRVDIIYEITEGPVSYIDHIRFIGNTKISTADLKSAIFSKERSWWRLFTNADVFDRNKVEVDKEVILRHYRSRGFINAKVLAETSELLTNYKGFYITYIVNEGKLYKFGNIKFNNKVKDLTGIDFSSFFKIKNGQVYSEDEMEKAVYKLNTNLAKLGASAISIKPDIDIDEQNNSVNVTVNIEEGEKLFVEKINITGNTRTLDPVIRRDSKIKEGDLYNVNEVAEFKKRLMNTGYFTDVQISKEEGAKPNSAVLDVNVVERSTGALEATAGWNATNGGLVAAKYSDDNFMGRGQQFLFGGEYSQYANQFKLNLTEPYFLGKPIEFGGGVNISFQDRTQTAGYTTDSKGFSLRSGYRLNSNLRHTVTYSFSLDHIKAGDNINESTANIEKDQQTIKDMESKIIKDLDKYIKADNTYIAEDIPYRVFDTSISVSTREQFGESKASVLGSIFTYADIDRKHNTRDGYSLTLEQYLAGLGGTVNYHKHKVSGALYVPWGEKVTFSAKVSGGYIGKINNEDNIRIIDRFSLGYTTLRGFAFDGVGPRDIASRGRGCIRGTKMYTASIEATTPLNAFSDYDFRLHGFVDMGAVWDTGNPADQIKVLAKNKNDKLQVVKNVIDDSSIRASVGLAVSFDLPFIGSVTLSYAVPVMKKDYDNVERLQLITGINF